MDYVQAKVRTGISGQQLLSDDGHSAGGRGGGVEAAAVGAVGGVCAVRASISLLVVGTSIQAPTLVGCRITDTLNVGAMLQAICCTWFTGRHIILVPKSK